MQAHDKTLTCNRGQKSVSVSVLIMESVFARDMASGRDGDAWQRRWACGNEQQAAQAQGAGDGQAGDDWSHSGCSGCNVQQTAEDDWQSGCPGSDWSGGDTWSPWQWEEQAALVTWILLWSVSLQFCHYLNMFGWGREAWFRSVHVWMLLACLSNII